MYLSEISRVWIITRLKQNNSKKRKKEIDLTVKVLNNGFEVLCLGDNKIQKSMRAIKQQCNSQSHTKKRQTNGHVNHIYT